MHVTSEPKASAPEPAAAATEPTHAEPRPDGARPIAGDLYALLVYLHKSNTVDLLDALGVLDLTMSQCKILQRLEEIDDDVSLKHVSELMGLSLPAVSRAVDDLVRRGMIERREDADDRRMKRIRLTEPGRMTYRRLNAARLGGLERFAETLTTDERRTLVAALARLLRRPEIAVCRPEGPPQP